MRKAVLCLLLLGYGICGAAVSGAQETYIVRLEQVIEQSRGHLPELTASAEKAAALYIAGGTLWAAGRQEDFIAEACGRAGGLMSMQALGKQSPGDHDIVLYAAPGSLNAEDLALIQSWEARGVLVVRFASADGVFDNRAPVDTVANVINLWVWTGELTAACTRLGKMPILYQSYGLPGGIERGKKYQGKKFHEDLQIEPQAGGILGKAYLDKIAAILNGIDQSQKPQLMQAVRWRREVPKDQTIGFVIGHMFPQHFKDARAAQWCEFSAAPAWEDPNLIDAVHPPQLVLYIGYQFAPRRLVEQAKALNVKLVYTDVEPVQPPQNAANILYIDPGWPLTDGCVAVPGYDIPILPASGVMQAAIYWSILTESGE